MRFASGLRALVNAFSGHAEAGLRGVPERAGGSIALVLGLHRRAIHAVLHPTRSSRPKDARKEQNDADHDHDTHHGENLGEDPNQRQHPHRLVLPMTTSG